MVIARHNKLRYEDYQYIFTKILNHPKSLEKLMQHMVNEHNEESLQFYVQCLEFDTFVGPTEKLLSLIRFTYDSYVDPKGKRPLNLSSAVVETITRRLSQFEQLNVEQQTPANAKQIFIHGITCALYTIENDTFPRFVRSELWLNWVKRTFLTEADLNTVAIHKSQLRQELVSSYDEERMIMTGKDLDLVRNLTRDGVDWKLRYEKVFKDRKIVRSVSEYSSSLNILDSECEEKHGTIWTSKTVWSFNCSAKDVFEVLFSQERYSDVFVFSHVQDGKSTILKVEDMLDPMTRKPKTEQSQQQQQQQQQQHSQQEETEKQQDVTSDAGENINKNENDNNNNENENDSSSSSSTSSNCPIFSEDLANQMLNSYCAVLNLNTGIPLARKRFVPICGATVLIKSPEGGSTYFDLIKPFPLKALDQEDVDKKGKDVLMRLYNYCMFHDLGENSSQWVQVVSTAFGGNIKNNGDNRIAKLVEGQLASKFLGKASKRMERALQSYFEAGRPPLTDKFGKYALVKMNESIVQELEEKRKRRAATLRLSSASASAAAASSEASVFSA